ncbi:hypothetical protein BGW38_004305 [Lunasporangiospora selenospora]|uniref:Glutathione hydrolase n=1 Tax=Lunasporangiospora selenospora TaxID=979761 RepID=A0A9P6KGT0_9FUNG|nr:hypothetical protein BGW38_004305 [Lunasporangiospora selenospora]
MAHLRPDRLSAAELGQSTSSPRQSFGDSGDGNDGHYSDSALETTPFLQDANKPKFTKHPNTNGDISVDPKASLTVHGRRKIILVLRCLSVLLCICVAVALALKIGRVEAVQRNAPVLVKAKSGAVAAEEIHCSEIGVQVLQEGGNAVDAAIASCLCIGTVNSFSAGIGGGGFMTIRLPNGTVEVIDFRETAPAASTPKMFKDDPSLAQTGGLAVGVPGEIRGLELAHKRHGNLPWKRLFAPSIQLARDGWAVGPELAIRIERVKELMETNPAWSEVFAPEGTALVEGQWIKRKVYAETLQTIAQEGPDAFYTGKIAKQIVDFTRSQGGILTMKDMRDYKALVREPVVGFYQGRKVYTTPAPTSGPALISILNIIERYNMGGKGPRANVDTHRLVEAMKFGYAQRTELGDPDFTNLEETVRNMLSKDTAARIRANISDTRTFPVRYYNPHWGGIENHGTTHLSVVDANNMAVTLTSTVNLLFGSKLLDPLTGVILNDEMDDFSIPGVPNAFELEPSPFNFPEPGKRSLSSSVPTIIECDGQFEMALGGSGGSRILTSVLQTMLNVYNRDMNVMDAIESPRIHHQLMPDVLDIEEGYPASEISFLRSIGHNVTIFDRSLAKAEVQVVMRDQQGFVFASSDSRKHQAIAAGY